MKSTRIDLYSWTCQKGQRQIIDSQLIDSHPHFMDAQKRDAGKEVALGQVQPDVRTSAGLEQLIAASRISPSQAFSRKQKEFQVQNLISQMPHEAQEVLRLRFVEGLPTKKIGIRMQKSDAAVRVLLRRKGKKMQTEIGLENLTS